MVGRRQLDHLDLVELVLADHPARVLAGSAGLGAKARRVSRQPDRQAVGRDDLVAVEVRQRDLARRDQVQRVGVAARGP